MKKMQMNTPKADRKSTGLTKLSGSEIGKNFLKNGSVHGLKHSFYAKGSCKRTLWLTLILGGFGALIYNTVALVQLYFAFPVLVKTSYKSSSQLDFPAVTVCNYNPIKRSLLGMSPRIQALVSSWEVRKENAEEMRRSNEMGTLTVQRKRRSVLAPAACFCQTDYYTHVNSTHYSCFWSDTNEISWEDANDACAAGLNLQEGDAHLAVIHNMDVLNFVNANLEFSPIQVPWIGLSSNATASGNRVWVDGTTYTDDYTYNVDLLQDGDCGAMWVVREQMRLFGCSNLREYICEYRVNVAPGNVVCPITETTDVPTTEQTTQEGTTMTSTEMTPFSTIGTIEHSTATHNDQTTDALTTIQSQITRTEVTSQEGLETSVLPTTTAETTPGDYTMQVSTNGSGFTVSSQTISVSSAYNSSSEVTASDTSTASRSTVVDSMSTVRTLVQSTGTAEDGVLTEHVTSQEPIATVESTADESTSTEFYDHHTIIDDAASTDSPPIQSQYTEGFLQENDILIALSELPVELKTQMGYTRDELVIDCKYKGLPCNTSEFGEYFNVFHGNCFVFNGQWQDEAVHKASFPGQMNGVALTLNLAQDSYIPMVSDGAGALVIIHRQKAMPFPEDNGVLVPPGSSTTIAIRQSRISRLGGPFSRCIEEDSPDLAYNLFAEHLPVNYSLQTCQKTCYQQHVIRECACADPQFPITGRALPHTNTPCNARNATQESCIWRVQQMYNRNELKCDCPLPCHDTTYTYMMTKSIWPAEHEHKTFLDKYGVGKNITADQRLRYIEQNFARINVYFDDMIVRDVKEVPKYPFVRLGSNLAATMGLWLGFTVLTMCEIIELGFDVFVRMVMALIDRIKCTKRPCTIHPVTNLASERS